MAFYEIIKMIDTMTPAPKKVFIIFVETVQKCFRLL